MNGRCHQKQNRHQKFGSHSSETLDFFVLEYDEGQVYRFIDALCLLEEKKVRGVHIYTPEVRFVSLFSFLNSGLFLIFRAKKRVRERNLERYRKII